MKKYIFLLVMTTNYLFGQNGSIDNKISFTCYSDFDSKAHAIGAKLGEQAKADFSVALVYISIQRTSLKKVGMSDAAYELWCEKILNNKTPREILVIAGGMMLSECVNSFDQKEPGKELDEKLSPQRQKYLKQMRSYGEWFLKEYGTDAGQGQNKRTGQK
jgi:hypothetical protein